MVRGDLPQGGQRLLALGCGDPTRAASLYLAFVSILLISQLDETSHRCIPPKTSLSAQLPPTRASPGLCFPTFDAPVDGGDGDSSQASKALMDLLGPSLHTALEQDCHHPQGEAEGPLLGGGGGTVKAGGGAGT